MGHEKPLEIVEIVGSLPENLKDKSAYLGFEPSGSLHKGHLNPIKALNWLAKEGTSCILWVADIHTSLNGKEVSSDWEKMRKFLHPKVKVLLQSNEIKLRPMEYLDKLLLLSKRVTFNRCKRTIECAGRDETETIKMSSLIYALMQAVDINFLDVDIVVGGIDQRKVHMLTRDEFPKLGWKVPICIHTKILLGKDGAKMSKSNPKYCELI